MLRYFTEDEFNRAKPGCSLRDMNESFMARLDEARHIAGVPFIINSAYRSKAYEISKGREGTSSHTKGLAVDLRCNTGFQRLQIVSSLLKVGFTRIGLHRNFIHVDYDPQKNQSIWLY